MSRKKQILTLLLSTAICLFGVNALKQMERGWRLEIDGIIEKKLEAAGFQKFDGIGYSFPISDEVLGVVQIYNQELSKRPDPERAIINTRLGIIDYQLNASSSVVDQGKMVPYKMYRTTIGNSSDNGTGVFIEMFDLYRTQPLQQKEAAIDNLVARINREAVPELRKKFSTTSDVTNFLTENKHRNEELYCIALAATGQAAKAKQRADWNSANLGIARVHKTGWPQFKPKFDKWVEAGAVVPNLEDARTYTMKAAEEGRIQISNTPKDQRPIW